MPLEQCAAAVRLACDDALGRPYMAECRARLDSAGRTPAQCVEAIRQVGEDPATLTAVTALIAEIAPEGALPAGVPERFMILHAILAHLDAVPSLPLAPSVQAYVYEALRDFAAHEARHAWCRAGAFSFTVIARKATLRIFPAGEFYWEVSGFPRSWLAEIAPASLPGALVYLATHFKGFRPAFFFHLDPGRRVRALSPDGLNACYHRMAQCLALQPHVKGILTVGWLHSPDTYAVSPHLAWRNQTVLDNGGFVGRTNRLASHQIVFHRSPERRKAYEAGRFIPKDGLVLWAAGDMRRWAARHPELAERAAP